MATGHCSCEIVAIPSYKGVSPAAGALSAQAVTGKWTLSEGQRCCAGTVPHLVCLGIREVRGAARFQGPATLFVSCVGPSQPQSFDLKSESNIPCHSD